MIFVHFIENVNGGRKLSAHKLMSEMSLYKEEGEKNIHIPTKAGIKYSNWTNEGIFLYMSYSKILSCTGTDWLA